MDHSSQDHGTYGGNINAQKGKYRPRQKKSAEWELTSKYA